MDRQPHRVGEAEAIHLSQVKLSPQHRHRRRYHQLLKLLLFGKEPLREGLEMNSDSMMQESKSTP